MILVGSINGFGSIFKSGDIASLTIGGIMLALGIGIVMHGKVALILSTVLSACLLGLAFWMIVIVHENDDNWSIYGDNSTLFHGFIIIVGLYNGIISICGYLSRNIIFKKCS